ncbi:MAG: hypothetical protein MUE51_01805 [Thermoleophilia bacterium]|nr:hypothetical protein [Thermoleophilia bacterium]
MGRIADAALALLAGGPRSARELGDALASEGVTRSRDPAGAVRRALRDDTRVVELEDGRLVSKAQALQGVVLSAVVAPRDVDARAVEVDPDLAPLAMIGVGPSVPLPRGTRPGQVVVVRIEDPVARRLVVQAVDAVDARTADEAALVGAIMRRLDRGPGVDPLLVPPVVALGPLVLGITAGSPEAFRTPGRPITTVLADAGLETHLGWVGREGTAWQSLTEVEAEIMEIEVEDLAHDERFGPAAAQQARLVALLERHLPERLPPARRRLAQLLARDGRHDEALAALRDLIVGDDPDPENLYQGAVVALGGGDLVTGRRLVQEGLARSEGPGDQEVAACLADLADDLDAQAAFRRLAERGPGGGRDAAVDAAPQRIARALLGLRRSYLIEAAAEGMLAAMGADELEGLIEVLGTDGGADGREACLALAVVLPGEVGQAAWRAAGGARAVRPGVSGLMSARPVAAWATSPDDAPDQQQIVIAVGKEDGRIGPLVALVDFDELGGAVKDAFFLPDMIEARLRREVFSRMEETGIPPHPVDVEDAVAVLEAGLATARQINWALPSAEEQPVLDRIERLVLRPMRGGAGPVRP